MQHKWLSCFHKKQHDDYFSDIKLISFYCNTKLDRILVTYACKQTCQMNFMQPSILKKFFVRAIFLPSKVKLYCTRVQNQLYQSTYHQAMCPVY